MAPRFDTATKWIGQKDYTFVIKLVIVLGRFLFGRATQPQNPINRAVVCDYLSCNYRYIKKESTVSPIWWTARTMRSVLPFVLAFLNGQEKRSLVGRSNTEISQCEHFRETTAMTTFVSKYLDRIGLDPSTFDDSTPKDHALLCRLTEAHLSTIPFENLAQHGGHGGPVELNLEIIADKILDRKRGGFCLELNGLFAALLEQLGFHVVIVPAVVHMDGPIGFDRPATHVILMVTLPNQSDHNPMTYFVDVGFGEPPANPLRYEFGREQVTSEGMKSRIIESDGIVTLEWFKDEVWKSRLRWELKESLKTPSPSIKDFQHILGVVYNEASNFSNKMIVCRLTLEKKLTLAGCKFKVTGPPRHGDDGEGQVKLIQVDSLQQARNILLDHFGIPLEETEQLDWQRISAQDPILFAQM